MSDGPHKSLNMSRRWKKVAEVADNGAYSDKDVQLSMMDALANDWNHVSDALSKRVEEIVDRGERMLFPEEYAVKLKGLYGTTDDSELGRTFLDFAVMHVADGTPHDQICDTALESALRKWLSARNRQIEEHYLRRSGSDRAAHLRERVKRAAITLGSEGVVNLLGARAGKSGPKALVKRTGLDDGVPL